MQFKKVTIFLVSIAGAIFIAFSGITFSERPVSMSDRAIKKRVAEGFAVSAITRTAIDVQYGMNEVKLGTISIKSSSIGLEQPASYHSAYVRSVSYDSYGLTIIQLTADKRLGKAAGATIILKPTPNSNESGLNWGIGSSTTVPRKYLDEKIY